MIWWTRFSETKAKMKNKFLLLLFCIALTVLFVPYPTVTIPEWQVRVVDENGTPIMNFEVRQTWSNGSGRNETVESQITNEQGFATFPARREILPLSFRLVLGFIGWVNNLIMPHGSLNSGYARIWAPEGNHSWLWYREGGEMNDTLVIRR